MIRVDPTRTRRSGPVRVDPIRLLYLPVIVSFRLLHCNVIYLAHAYILNFQISNCNVFVYVTLAFLRYPIVTVFIVTTFATRSVSNIP